MRVRFSFASRGVTNDGRSTGIRTRSIVWMRPLETSMLIGKNTLGFFEVGFVVTQAEATRANDGAFEKRWNLSLEQHLARAQFPRSDVVR